MSAPDAPGVSEGGAPERTAIVTGGGSGIGLAIAERLAADGLAVAVFDLEGVAADDVAAKIAAETWNRVLEANLTGTFHGCQAVVPDMIAAGWGRSSTSRRRAPTAADPS